MHWDASTRSRKMDEEEERPVSRWFDYNEESSRHRLQPGDLIEIDRGIYEHWAVYVGTYSPDFGHRLENPRLFHQRFGSCWRGRADHLNDRYVLHMTNGRGGGSSSISSSSSLTATGSGGVELDTLKNVLGDSKARINNHYDDQLDWDPEVTLDRAFKRYTGRGCIVDGYDLILNNCQHFANWCRYGVHKGDQVAKKAELMCVLV